ncbi:MAG: HAMP domain-containing histidine kinase [Acidobacteria bacterium]|nr:HAMP domain-containing histidine kinase [Acidobacteriota bacterium]
MDVALLSKDNTLVGFCREVLEEMFGTGWTLRQEPSGRIPDQSDLYIWDYTPGETILPESLDLTRLRSHWFLLRLNDLHTLQERLGTSDINVLLKPVTRATLRAFLEGAKSRHDEHDGKPSGRLGELLAERDKMLQFLIQANLKLQEYDQERSNFLARSLHDFRAPLTAIGGYCGLLLEGELGPLTPEQRQILGRMQQSSARLSRIGDAMFQLSIPRNLEGRARLENADIRDCVEQALHEVALPIDDKRIAVTVEIEPQPEGLLFEKAQLEQTVVNLLDNACKFTPRDGVIEIKGYPYFWERRTGNAGSFERASDRRVRQSRTSNSYRIDIRDSGPGVPAAQAEKVFEEYTSYYGGQDRSGGGLGLAICRRILQRHKGRIWAESSASGGGFSFIIPRQPTHIGLNGENGAVRVPFTGVLED